MNASNYIQYLTLQGQIKVYALAYDFFDNITSLDGEGNPYAINCVVRDISEPFYILNVFFDHKKQTGLIFDNVDNLDMLAYVNSDIVSVDAISENNFFPPNQMVLISKHFKNEFITTNQSTIYRPNIPYPIPSPSFNSSYISDIFTVEQKSSPTSNLYQYVGLYAFSNIPSLSTNGFIKYLSNGVTQDGIIYFNWRGFFITVSQYTQFGRTTPNTGLGFSFEFLHFPDSNTYCVRQSYLLPYSSTEYSYLEYVRNSRSRWLIKLDGCPIPIEINIEPARVMERNEV